MLLTLLIHEASHYAVARVVGEQISELELTPLGGIMRYKPGFVPNKGIKGVLVHCAGPAGNWAVLLAAGIPSLQQMNPAFIRSFLCCNTAMLAINLLPILPLDGGHIVFCLGYYFFPVSGLIRCLSVLGQLAGILGILLSIYGLLWHQLLNCSLLIISLYLLICARQNHKALLAENVYTVVHERMTQPLYIRKIIQYQVPADTSLFDLLDFLRQNTSVSFVFSINNKVCELTEHMFCQALMVIPNPTIAEAYTQMIHSK